MFSGVTRFLLDQVYDCSGLVADETGTAYIREGDQRLGSESAVN